MKLVFISSLFLAFSFTTTAQKTIDKIAAQVGDNIILLSDIQSQKIQAAQAGIVLTPEMDCSMLEELMYQNLLVNQAKLDSIDISIEVIDSEMEQRLRVIENQIGSRQKMEEFYGKTVAQIKNEFRPIIGDQLRAQEMERQITADVAVTPRDVRAFYKLIPVDSIPLINSQMSFQQIVIYPEIGRNEKKLAKLRLSGIRDEIMAGKPFSTAARLNSDDPGSASQGGKISASKGMMVRPFEATVFSLKEGEVSQVVETEYGYHVIKLLKRLGDDYTCRHILIVPTFEDKAIESAAYQLDTCYQKLQAGELTWEEAVIMYSNDEFTKLNNGIITNPTTGDQQWDALNLNRIDQQIYLLTQNMKVGDISQPKLYSNMADRKQGVRIVRLMNRTKPHQANLTEDYSLIQRAAENEKKRTVINTWVADKIASTYIRINEPFQDCTFANPWMKR
ncbi:MAG: peptidylprolyl isomerase [Crocinitomicaceae bacterium]|nr:peptidylprolyl isomerase [Flavobacteriales bacterium]NQZ36979.1 peptidylprolyl isomerase [Crocinitomicaceae bacterium]